MIQSFEYTHELSWNVLEIFEIKNTAALVKDTIRAAFAVGLIQTVRCGWR